MISDQLYRTMNNAWWRGRRVRALNDLSNGYMRVAKGTILTITRKRGGFDLMASRCKHCRVSVFIRHVRPHELELVGQQW